MEALPSDRAEYQGKLLNATARQKNVDNDAQLLQNRIALLKKEEARAWRKIQQTKGRAEEIGTCGRPLTTPTRTTLPSAWLTRRCDTPTMRIVTNRHSGQTPKVPRSLLREATIPLTAVP